MAETKFSNGLSDAEAEQDRLKSAVAELWWMGRDSVRDLPPATATWPQLRDRCLIDIKDSRLTASVSVRADASLSRVSPVEPTPEPPKCVCSACEPLVDPGQRPSLEDINRLEKAAWDSKTDRVLVWYRDQIGLYQQRIRETERAWQLERKQKPTGAPAPCVWRDIASAPKDETPIRLKWAGTTVEAIGRWCPAQVLPSGFGRSNYSDDWRDVEGDDVLLLPTHWKPVIVSPPRPQEPQPAEPKSSETRKPVVNLMEALKKSLDSLNANRTSQEPGGHQP